MSEILACTPGSAMRFVSEGIYDFNQKTIGKTTILPQLTDALASGEKKTIEIEIRNTARRVPCAAPPAERRLSTALPEVVLLSLEKPAKTLQQA